MKPTPLRGLARHLGGPDTDDAAELASWAGTVGRGTDRRAAVARYLLAASTGGLTAPRSGRGSLKHLAWWLRDHAGSLYEPALTAVLEAALAADWPLERAADALRDHPLVGGFAHQALAAEPAEELARHLVWEDTPRGRIAWNRTTLNLSKIAFRGGADYYAAVSLEGGCLMARRGLVIEGFPLGDWVQPYPNLAVLARPGRLEDEMRIRTYLLGGRGGEP